VVFERRASETFNCLLYPVVNLIAVSNWQPYCLHLA